MKQFSMQLPHRSIFPKKIRHLIRYFIPLGLVCFVLYWMSGGSNFSLLLIGPPLFLSYWAKKIVESAIGVLPSTETFNDLVFLLPVALLYFGLLGFQFKQLWNERGFVRIVTLFALIAFLIYIHYGSWQYFLGFYRPLP